VVVSVRPTRAEFVEARLSMIREHCRREPDDQDRSDSEKIFDLLVGPPEAFMEALAVVVRELDLRSDSP